MNLRRGFKKEANKIAVDIRTELSLSPSDPLDPLALAKHLDIPVLPLADLRLQAPEAVSYFSSVNSSEFSALTVFDGTRRLIVHNDSHAKGRQTSNLSHEIAHGLLLHDPTTSLNENGCREWDQEMEDEADWLGATLLITEEAALKIARAQISDEKAALLYGTSVQLMRWRMSVTAARKRASFMR